VGELEKELTQQAKKKYFITIAWPSLYEKKILTKNWHNKEKWL
jgi:hypothetical protein